MSDALSADGNLIGVNIDVLVMQDAKVLLGLFKAEDGKKYWGVPGKSLAKGETFGDAAKRSVKEEIGCEVSRYVVFAANANHASGNHYIGIGMYAEVEGRPVNAHPDVWEKWEWFGITDLPMNIFPPAWNVIKCFKDKRVCAEE